MSTPNSEAYAGLVIPDCITKFICSINSLNGKQVGCGIIMMLNHPDESEAAGAKSKTHLLTEKKISGDWAKHFPALNKPPYKDSNHIKAAINSNWVLLTTHHVTCGSSVSIGDRYLRLPYTNGNGEECMLDFKLKDVVTASISCCGLSSIIGPGNVDPNDAALRNHTGGEPCTIELGFTISFLDHGCVTDLEATLGCPCTINSTANGRKNVYIVYRGEEGRLEPPKLIESSIEWPQDKPIQVKEDNPVQEEYVQPSLQSHVDNSLQSDVDNFKANLHYLYPENETCSPGGLLINASGAVIGIHVGVIAKKNKKTGGLKLSSVMQLLQGKCISLS